MAIEINDIESVAKATNLTFTESNDWFKFYVDKQDHRFEVLVLKSGQYIFVQLFIEKREFPIEHIEFFSNESITEILEELAYILNLLSQNESRFTEKKNWFGTKMKAEIKEKEKWTLFGYPGNEVKRKAST